MTQISNWGGAAFIAIAVILILAVLFSERWLERIVDRWCDRQCAPRGAMVIAPLTIFPVSTSENEEWEPLKISRPLPLREVKLAAVAETGLAIASRRKTAPHARELESWRHVPSARVPDLVLVHNRRANDVGGRDANR